MPGSGPLANDTYEELRQAILLRIEPTVRAANLDPSMISCQISAEGPKLIARLSGPPIDSRSRQALAVRVMDAIRAGGRVYGPVVVGYSPED